MTTPNDKTCAARLTPPATGAIATLALHGPESWRILEALFQPAGKNEPHVFFERIRREAEPGQFWAGKLGEPENGRDDVVLALKSKEPVPSFEIHCHGGIQVVEFLQECLVSRGAEKCTWQELGERISGDYIQVLAQHALSEAATLLTANILLHQYHGAFSKAIHAIVASLEVGQYQKTLEKLQLLARWVPLGRRLTSPWRVAVAGAPNVGKSSLINRLAGYQRSVVTATPGTTRDVVTTRIALDGWPVELIDTAGVREKTEELERQGIDLARDAISRSDLCLWLVETSAEPLWPTGQIPDTRLLTVINKIDLPAIWDLDSAPDALRISAQSGAGMDDLCTAVIKNLLPENPAPGAAVPFTPALCDGVEEALQLCTEENWQEAKRILEELCHAR